MKRAPWNTLDPATVAAIEALARTGKYTNVDIARRLGISGSVVSGYRAKLGIRPSQVAPSSPSSLPPLPPLPASLPPPPLAKPNSSPLERRLRRELERALGDGTELPRCPCGAPTKLGYGPGVRGADPDGFCLRCARTLVPPRLCPQSTIC